MTHPGIIEDTSDKGSANQSATGAGTELKAGVTAINLGTDWMETQNSGAAK